MRCITQAVLALLVLPALVFAEDLRTFESPGDQEWLQRVQHEQDLYRKSIPANARKALKKFSANFEPFLFREHDSEGEQTVTQGDFNCDGKVDFAITGILRGSVLSKAVASRKIDHQSLKSAQKEFDWYLQDKPAIVMVGLSSHSGIRWVRERGTYVRYEKENCGCCNNTKDSELAWIKKERCGFLYLGCCEKDGKYIIWQKESDQIRLEDGC